MVETSLVPHTGFRTGRLRIKKKKKETDLKSIFSITPASVLVTIMDSEGKSAAVHEDEANHSTNLQNSIPILLLLLYCPPISC